MTFAWGYNELATLGLGYTSRVKTVPHLTLPDWDQAVELEASASHSSARFADGHVEVVGGNSYDAACDGKPASERTVVLLEPSVVPVSPARSFSLCESAGMAILADGTGVTWGGNIYGQAGVGTWAEGKERLEPPGVYATAQEPQFGAELAQCGGGQYHKLAVTTTGTVLAWGGNEGGKLGDGTEQNKLVPVPVSCAEPVIAIDGGRNHTLLLGGNGLVYGCGRGKQGQFGHPGGAGRQADVLTPVAVEGVEGCRAIAAGGDGSLFLLEDGTVLKCGREQPLERVALPGPATAVSAGTLHNLYIVAGEVFAEGRNEWGQLGDGTREPKTVPVALGVPAREVSAGVGHSICR